MFDKISKKILGVAATLCLVSAISFEDAAASACFLAANDQSCVRIDATGELAFNNYLFFQTVILHSITPHQWINGQTLGGNEATPTLNPDMVEFNIVFSPLGTSVSASQFIIFTDRFKLRDITGDIDVSLWLTDYDHNIITEVSGFGNDAVARTTKNVNVGDEWEAFNLSGMGYMLEEVEWWDYHLAFDFSNATLGANAGIELVAPSEFSVCDSGQSFTDGPCAFGTNIGINVALDATPTNATVPAPGSVILLGIVMLGLARIRSTFQAAN